MNGIEPLIARRAHTDVRRSRRGLPGSPDLRSSRLNGPVALVRWTLADPEIRSATGVPATAFPGVNFLREPWPAGGCIDTVR
jgi:hypothetical protein